MESSLARDLGEKRRVNVTIGSKLIDAAKALGINVSQGAEEGLLRKVREAQATKWLDENRDAMLAYNEWIKVNGTFGDKVRAWKKKNGAV
jgi:antitoxin CcdA